MCTIHLIELTVAWQNSKPVPCKCIAIQRLCMNQYPSFIYTQIQSYIFSVLSVLFCKIQELRNPTLKEEKKNIRK